MVNYSSDLELKESDLLEVEEILKYYQDDSYNFPLKQFLLQVENFFSLNPLLIKGPLPSIHSIKTRLKNPEHLRDKIIRKKNEGRQISKDTLSKEITDLAGVRVLHLHQEQFELIHDQIKKKIETGDWLLAEPPKAYTWDPETKLFYENLGINVELKDTFYTSVHYVVKPNSTSDLYCEIQVRTLFEEIWGEIDHAINYPHKTQSIACSEQLRVLSKLVSTGTRLSDSIFRSHSEYVLKNSDL